MKCHEHHPVEPVVTLSVIEEFKCGVFITNNPCANQADLAPRVRHTWTPSQTTQDVYCSRGINIRFSTHATLEIIHRCLRPREWTRKNRAVILVQVFRSQRTQEKQLASKIFYYSCPGVHRKAFEFCNSGPKNHRPHNEWRESNPIGPATRLPVLSFCTTRARPGIPATWVSPPVSRAPTPPSTPAKACASRHPPPPLRKRSRSP